MSKCAIITADVLEGLAQLDAESVHCVVTSPPYFALRDYGIPGQIGREQTPAEYIAKMVEVFGAVRRVLRKDGTVWLNIGDGYNAYNGNRGASKSLSGNINDAVPMLPAGHGLTVKDCKPKDLLGIPWLLAFALRADGWYLRSDIIWHKPNPMPESVTDRPTSAHEHLFLLAKSPKYFYDAEAIKEPMIYTGLRNQDESGFESALMFDGKNALENGHARTNKSVLKQDALGDSRYTGFNKRWDENMKGDRIGLHPDEARKDGRGDGFGRATRNKRTVWTIPTEPYAEAHFATFPTALVKPCVLAGTSERGCCGECGAPWVREVETNNPSKWAQDDDTRGFPEGRTANAQSSKSLHRQPGGVYSTAVTKGWRPSCKHDAPVVPCTVCDPFMGSGTTGMVAMGYGRHFVGIELNPDYSAMAERRLHSAVSQEVLAL